MVQVGLVSRCYVMSRADFHLSIPPLLLLLSCHCRVVCSLCVALLCCLVIVCGLVPSTPFAA